ncbi:MAG: hypothetical protein ACHRHE_18040 [Tepidisphaerales bacterium]
MSRRKRRLTSAEKAAKRRRKRETIIIFVNGKQKRVKREPTIDGMSVDEFIRRNADPIWLHENEMWEYIETEESYCGQGIRDVSTDSSDSGNSPDSGDSPDEIPF